MGYVQWDRGREGLCPEQGREMYRFEWKIDVLPAGLEGLEQRDAIVQGALGFDDVEITDVAIVVATSKHNVHTARVLFEVLQNSFAMSAPQCIR